MTVRDYLDPAFIGSLIIHYRISGYAPALAELKDEVDLYHYTGDPMPGILRQFAHDEMQRNTPYQMPEGKGRKQDIDIIQRNKRISYMVASRPKGVPLRGNSTTSKGAYDVVADAEGLTDDQVSEYRKADRSRDKLLNQEWRRLLDPLPEADREEILDGLLPHMRDRIYPPKSD